jgi:Zn-dependent peptidase ImmA (M78 family)
MELRRGFKTEAHDIAREIRSELKLAPTDPLDPWLLANHLEIPIYTLSFMKDDAPFAAHQFSNVDPAAFSAVTVFCGCMRRIVHNDSHLIGRQSSNLAHELAHALLHHLPTPALNDLGSRNWDQTVENEANWLGGALLVSEEAALMIARNKFSLSQAALRYKVSEDMIRFRLNVTGAQKRTRPYTRPYWSSNKV